MTAVIPTREELLRPVNGRWSFAKKLDLITGVRHGVISQKEAMAAHAMSAEEFIQLWLAYERKGAEGLRATALRKAS